MRWPQRSSGQQHPKIEEFGEGSEEQRVHQCQAGQDAAPGRKRPPEADRLVEVQERVGEEGGEQAEEHQQPDK